MHRNFITNAGGETFFEKYRKGFNCILKEVSKLEHITDDLQGKPLDTSYFTPDIELLENVNPIYEDACQLYIAVSEKSINLDSIEQRLQNIREKLLKLEENAVLLKKGYKPYIPPDSPMMEQEPNHEGVIAELSFSSPTGGDVNENIPDDQVTPLSTSHFKKKEKSVSIDTPKSSASIGTSKLIDSDLLSSQPTTTTILPSKESPVINDPKLANYLNILKRWNSVDVKDTTPAAVLGPESVSRNKTFTMRSSELLKISNTPLLTASTKKITTISPIDQSVTSSSISSSTTHQKDLKSVSSQLKSSTSINRSKTFTILYTKPKQSDSDSTIEYETVEFTPGMTSKVRK